MVLKYCIVPCCKNNSLKHVNKVFVRVPIRPDVRKRWFDAVNATKRLSGNSTFVCEDHFDLEKDAENWIYYKLMGRKITLKKHVVPHIFPTTKEESSSQFTDAEKELKRQLLEQYKNDRLNPNKSNEATQASSNYNYNYFRRTNVSEINKNLFSNAESSDDEENSNDSTLSNEIIKPITPEKTIVPSRINIQIDPGLPELMYIREESPERHQPLLLRRKNKNNKTKTKNGPEVVWINPPMVEISNEDELENSIQNAGSLENEEQLADAQLLEIKSEPKLLQIKSESELAEIKQEEMNIEDFNVEDNTEEDSYLPTQSGENSLGHILVETETGIAVNPEMNMDISYHPASVQAYLNEAPQVKTEASDITIKEEPLDEPSEQTNDFEFVSVNIKQESSFFFEDPLNVPGRSIYVAKHTDESILS